MVYATTTDIATAYSTLRTTFNKGITRDVSWRLAQLKELRRMMEENKDQIGSALADDLGLTPEFGFFREYDLMLKGEIDEALRCTKNWARTESVEAPTLVFPSSCKVVKEPVGVVLIVAPWNYPVNLLLSPLVGAISAGCVALLKPSEVSARTSAVLAALLPKYLSRDAFILLEGGVDETTELLKLQWDHIFYTGSTIVGKVMMRAAAEHLTPVTLELGGKSPCVVDAGVDLKITAKRIILGKFQNCGQTCVAPDYLLVVKSIFEPFLATLKSELVKMFTENPKTCRDYPRIVSQRRCEYLAKMLKGAGGQLVHGGEIDMSDRYIAPTIVVDPRGDSSLMQEEIFGPILPIIIVDSIKDAVEFAAARPRPLASYIFSNSTEHQKLFSERVISGALGINEVTLQAALPTLPFGGVGPSGMGRYHSKHSFDLFTNAKAVLHSGFKFDPPVKYPPFTASKLKMLRSLMAIPSPGKLLPYVGAVTLGIIGGMLLL